MTATRRTRRWTRRRAPIRSGAERAPRSFRRRHAGAIAACMLTLIGAIAYGVSSPAARLGADAADAADAPTVLPNGRLLTPHGSRADLGDFPLGLAVNPQGTLAVTTNNGRGTGVADGFGSHCDDTGRFNQCGYVPAAIAGNPATPHPDESLSVVNLATGKVTDVTAVPTVRDPAHPQFNNFGIGVTFSPDGHHLYAVGGGNDAVYDFTVDGDHLVSPPRTLTLPSIVSHSPALPVVGKTSGWSKDLAVTPDGRSLLVVKEYDGDLSVVDTATMTLRQQFPLGLPWPLPVAGQYLYGVAIAPNGQFAYVTAQGQRTVWVVWLTPWFALPVGAIPVGDHPTGIAVAPDSRTVMVANANDDTVSVLDPAGWERQRLTVTSTPGERWGSVPNAVTFAPDSATAYVALAGDNAIAVLRRRANGSWANAGSVPTGWYPTAVKVQPGTHKVLAVAAKGLGARYLANGPYPAPTHGGPQTVPTSGYYDGDNMPGLLTAFASPSTPKLAELTAKVRANTRHATEADTRTPHNPIPATIGGASPITHVVYIVRENRTFDQIFGDLGSRRPDVDAAPDFALLGAATPNAHAVADRYAIADRFFSDGEASIQGHWWTAAANVDDYTEKSWRQNYSPRGKPYDYILGAAIPRGCTIFNTAQARVAETAGRFSYRDYGEIVGALNLGANASDRDCPSIPAENFATSFLAKIQDLGYDDRERAKLFLADVGLDLDGRQVGDPRTNYLRNFSYLALPSDHTLGFSGTWTPRAGIAQNDAGVGMVLQALSKSAYWPHTAVFVIEDDSQDGADHVDGHRNVLLVASPWTRHVSADGARGGYVGHRHYDQAGVVHTMELILGMQPMSSYDSQAAPLYDLFQDKNDPALLTADDLAPFPLAPAPPFIEERVADVAHSVAAPLIAQSKTLDLTHGVDHAGPGLEEIIWKSLRHDPVPPELQQRLDRAAAGSNRDDD